MTSERSCFVYVQLPGEARAVYEKLVARYGCFGCHSIAGFEQSDQGFGEFKRLREANRVSFDTGRFVRKKAQFVRTAFIENRPIRSGYGIHRNPNGHHVRRRLAEISVVLVRRHARTDVRRFVERLRAHMNRFAMNQAPDEIKDRRPLREFIEKRTMLLHPPKIARCLSVDFKSHFAGFQFRHGGSHVLLDFASDLLQFCRREKLSNPHDSVLFVIFQRSFHVHFSRLSFHCWRCYPQK